MPSPLRLAAVSFVFVAACSGDPTGTTGNNNNNNNNNGSVHGTISAKIDGASWAGSVAVSALYSGGILAVSGIDASYTSFTFAASAAAPGSFQVGGASGTNASLVMQPSKSWSANGSTGSGSVTVTTLTATGASGTFQFTVAPASGTTGNRAITQGVFNVKF